MFESLPPVTASVVPEIVNTRLFAASRERVFGAFGTPTELAQWWGPAGFTNTIHEFDLRPGGTWRLTMHAPDGANYENASTFTEVVRPSRVVYDHLDPVHGFRMTMIFDAPSPTTTVLTWRLRFALAEEAARLSAFIAAANEQNFDRLAAHLARHP